MKHTKEPWRVHLLDRRTMIASDGENGYLAETRKVKRGDIDVVNAKRIVACVNACEGITNEALEQGIVQAGLDELKLRHLNGKAIFADLIPELKTFMGVKIWEDTDGK